MPAAVRRALLVAAAVVGVLATVAALFVVDKDGEPAGDVLAGAQKAVADEDSVRFTARYRVESEESDGDRSGYVYRGRARGTAAFPDRFRLVERADEGVVEVIAVGDTYFVRDAGDEDELEAEKWGRYDVSEELRRRGVTSVPGQGGRPGGIEGFGQPSDIPDLVRSARHPVVVRRSDDATVVRAELDLDEPFVDAPDEIDDASVELTVGEDHRVERVLIRFSGEPGKGTIDYRLSTWGERVRVSEPPASDIDPTPDLDEEGIANFEETPLLQPRAIPEGWELDLAEVLEPDETEEGCRQVELDYIDPDDPDSGFLYIYELPASCAELEAPRGSRPFTAGRNRGWVDDSEEGTIAQLVVGTTVLQVETDLEPAELATVLDRPAPLDLAKPPPPLPRAGTRRSAA